MYRTGFIFLFCLLILPFGLNAQETSIVKYPFGSTDYSLRTKIGMSAVEMALKATEHDYGPWKIEPSQIQMERKRREATLEQGIKANVLMLPGKNEFDERFILVPVPLDKGLLGYRIAFVNSDHKDILKNVQSLEDMRKFKGCINSSWNITKIFEHNRLQLTYFNRYEALFAGIQYKRCDYFSRGIGEIKGEFEHFKSDFPSLAYENHVLLRTQLANYIYVNKGFPELAERIRIGLERSIKNGTFDVFFKKYYGKDIIDFALENRQVITLKSPSEHIGAPIDQANYWFGSQEFMQNQQVAE